MDADGNPIPLSKQNVAGQDIPLPDPNASGPHTTLEGQLVLMQGKFICNLLLSQKGHGLQQMVKTYLGAKFIGMTMVVVTIPIRTNIYLERLNIVEIFKEWGSEKFSQEPKKYEYKSILIFHENTEMSYYKNIVQNLLEVNDYYALTLEGKSLSQLEFLVNRKKGSEYESELITFFNELYNS